MEDSKQKELVIHVSFPRPKRHRLVLDSDDELPNWPKEIVAWMLAHAEEGQAIVDDFTRAGVPARHGPGKIW